MDDNAPIEINVPAPWKVIGRVFCGFSMLMCVGAFWAIFFWPGPPDADMLVAACILFFGVPIFCCFCMPVFLGRYPRWIVRLVGPKMLHRFIADCKAANNKDRADKANIKDLGSWFRDRKTFWILVIIICALTGFINALLK